MGQNKVRNSVTVEMPDWFLLQIAVHGNMGDGLLPELMRTWAQEECRRQGLDGRLLEMQKQRMKELTVRLVNVIGEEGVRELAKDIAKAGTFLKSLKE